MAAGFQDYLREAFNARPWGMFVAPNWVGLAAFGVLGFLNPGFWILGAGVELGYLFFLTSNSRFRHYVDSLETGQDVKLWQEKVAERGGRLLPENARRFQGLQERCESILNRQQATGPLADIQGQSENLGKLAWIYLGLLQTKQTVEHVVGQTGDAPFRKILNVEKQLQNETDESLRRSLEGQLEILKQRVATQEKARDKIEFLDAELSRIEEQVELIREQSLLGKDPGSVSRRIDDVTATLGSTTAWMREQQQAYSELEDILDEPPAIPVPQPPPLPSNHS
ncbi:MAG TPA: hypothetical protein VIT91_12645 [Chthoniobacterales bacterium]